MVSPKERLDRLRERHPWLDHVLRTLSHYGSVNAKSRVGTQPFSASWT